jgi:phosphatidate phosphatase APP1
MFSAMLTKHSMHHSSPNDTSTTLAMLITKKKGEEIPLFYLQVKFISFIFVSTKTNKQWQK